MKLLGLLVISFISFNNVALAHYEPAVILGSTVFNNCNEFSKSSDCGSNEKDEKSSAQDTKDSEHAHCSALCDHLCSIFVPTASLISYASSAVIKNFIISTSFTQTVLEGPFRPPLV